MKVEKGYFPLARMMLRYWSGDGQAGYDSWIEIHARQALAGIPSIYR